MCAEIKMHLGCICLGVCPFEFFGLFKFCQLQWELHVSTWQKIFSTGGQYMSLCSPEVLRIMYEKNKVETKIQWEPCMQFPVMSANLPVRGLLKAKGF